MPTTYTYPGVYVEELPSGVHTITGVSTSDTAFVDFFRQGPMGEATRITGFQDFQRVFGGLDSLSAASYQIRQFFENGGQVAWVVRVAEQPFAPASAMLAGGSPAQDSLRVEAANPGKWGTSLSVGIDHVTGGPNPGQAFNLTVRQAAMVQGKQQVVASETFRNLTLDQTSGRYAESVVAEESLLIRVSDQGLPGRPSQTGADVTSDAVVRNLGNTAFVSLGGSAADGAPPLAQTLLDGLEPLRRIAPYVFNILCLPRAVELDIGTTDVYDAAAEFCDDERAFLIVDIPKATNTTQKAVAYKNTLGPSKSAAVYYPRLVIGDPLDEFRPKEIPSSGTLAGIYARTDATRGVWKAPAGTDAVLQGVQRLTATLTDGDNGALNPLGVNALRSFPVYTNVSWGARTLQGADQQTSEWKYIPVRRTALYIEESLFQGLKWVVFEPNDEPLWAQIRLNVGAFMHDLFRQGAFQGTTPRDAYFVKCDHETTQQTDVDKGIVNIIVGFAPLKPAEFVVIKIQQLAGQIQT